MGAKRMYGFDASDDLGACGRFMIFLVFLREVMLMPITETSCGQRCLGCLAKTPCGRCCIRAFGKYFAPKDDVKLRKDAILGARGRKRNMGGKYSVFKSMRASFRSLKASSKLDQDVEEDGMLVNRKQPKSMEETLAIFGLKSQEQIEEERRKGNEEEAFRRKKQEMMEDRTGLAETQRETLGDFRAARDEELDALPPAPSPHELARAVREGSKERPAREGSKESKRISKTKKIEELRNAAASQGADVRQVHESRHVEPEEEESEEEDQEAEDEVDAD